MGTEDLSVLVHGPIVLTVLGGGPESRGGVRFCRWKWGQEEEKVEVSHHSKSFVKINWATFSKTLHLTSSWHLNQALASALPAYPHIS